MQLGKKFAPFAATFVVYLFVGIWHGADWKYVAYGIWNGLFIVCGILMEDRYKAMRERFGIREDSKWWHLFKMVRTFVIVSLGRVLSRANSLPDAFGIYKQLGVRFFDLSMFNSELMTSLGINMREWLLCLICVVVILFVDHLKEKKIDIRETLDHKPLPVRWCFYLLLILLILVFGKYGPGYDASNFIYGNF